MSPARPGAAPEDDRGGLEAAFGTAAFASRRRLTIGALVAVIVVTCLAVVLAWGQYDDEKAKALGEMKARVVLASTVFDTYFAGQLATLNAIADSPSVVRTDELAMQAYFARLQRGKAKTFSGGIGWIDRQGNRRVSSSAPRGVVLNVSDRSYFKAILSGRPSFVSEGVVARATNRRIVVMAVPTRDAAGRLTGVLAGALEFQPSATDQRSLDLGYEGLVVLDRARRQVTLTNFAPPRNTAILPALQRGEGVLSDTKGLDGDDDRVVAFANSSAPGWTSVIDRPRSVVFASARRTLRAELVVIGAALLIVLCMIGWAIARSRRDQEAERRQIRHWDELAQSLGDASATAEVSAALGSSLVTLFPGARVIVAVQDADRSELVFSTYEPAGAPPLAAGDPSVEAVARLAYDAGARVATADEEREAPLPQGLSEFEPPPRSLLGVPLLTPSGRVTGSVTLLLPGDEPLPDADEALLAAHAEHAARALARARLHEREHDVAVALQRSLLPDALPSIEGLDLAGRYNAGGLGLEVGGDWYDAVRRPDGIVHLTVGDVAGRGIPAAVLMAQLRNAFRALAFEHTSPAEIAERLTRLVAPGGMATAVFLTLDPYTGELTYASAGHPPSLLLDAETGLTSRLDEANAPPLGWVSAVPTAEARIMLPERATILAYTDGLVERRDAGIDEGIDRLAGLLQEKPEEPAGGAADRLLERIVTPLSGMDDIALLLTRVIGVPARMELEIPADPHLMRSVRARLRAWLQRRGVGEAQQADAVLAVAEACNNAIEHAYVDSRSGTIRIRLDHGPGSLAISVEDQGSWRLPRHDPTRGRGTMIMKGTMDRATIATDETGTRVDLELRIPVGAGVSGTDDALAPARLDDA